MSYPPKKSAEWFIKRAEMDGKLLTQMQLQKLVYIAHGWHLAVYNEPLVNEAVEAWKWGPVLRSLYRSYADFGSNHIISLVPTEKTDDFPPGTSELLGKVWNVYGRYNGSQLSAMTHRNGTPWSETFNANASPPNKIPNEIIQKHYQHLGSKN